MENLSEYSDNYSKKLGYLWQYYKNEPNATLNHSDSFKSKIKIIEKPLAVDNRKDVEIAVLLKHFWRTLEMALIKCD